jgi:ankyrin repeat protein
MPPLVMFVTATGVMALRLMTEPSSGDEVRVEAFFEAARVGDLAALQQAVVHDRLPVDLRESGSGMTPLMRAVSARRAASVEWLLAHGADINAYADIHGTSLAVAATREDGTAMVRLLLDHGADPDGAGGNANRFTPLMQAATSGNPRSVDMLLRAGARPELRDPAGNTAASLAEQFGYPEIAEMLRQAAQNVRTD